MKRIEDTTSHMSKLLFEAIDIIYLYLQKETKNLKIIKYLWWGDRKPLHKFIFSLVYFNTMLSESKKFIYDIYKKAEYIKAFFSIDNSLNKYEEVFNYLSNEDSQKIFDYIFIYRIAYTFIGEEASIIFPYTLISELETNKYNGIQPIKKSNLLYKVKDYLINTDYDVVNGTWYRCEYLYKGIFEPQNGDTIISCGAYMGETTIWFADKVGKTGKIYAFEPTLDIFSILLNNIRQNELNDIVKVFNYGLWNENKYVNFITSNELVRNVCNSAINAKENNKLIKVVTIDTFIENEEINKINLIKMDIEGSELNALIGASQTIIKYRPKLAICIYHLADDIFKVPIFIKSLVPEYKFYLSQKNEYEVILFASI